ncbi:Holliday junction branch migration protein RuvA [bacterium]|nr:Holliday junction branch migration protein RuvA [bacterium]
MIEYIVGKLVEKLPERVVVEAGGVGIVLLVSFSTYQDLGEVGSNVRLLTHLQFREPLFDLFGFSRPEERDVFRLLIQVSGVGAKLARTILSGMRPQEVRRAIIENDLKSLASVPGIGHKTAERLVVFLKDKASIMMAAREPAEMSADRTMRDAISGLISLGIPTGTSEKIVRKVIKRMGSDMGLDDLVRESLKMLF